MFKGLYLLYTCYIIKEEYTKIVIRYSQPNCKHTKTINYILYSTNNYKFYYYNTYPDILTFITKKKEQLKAQANILGSTKQFFNKLASNQNHN